MALTKRRVTQNYTDFLERPVSGRVTFTPSVAIETQDGTTTYAPDSFDVELVNGVLNVDLPVNDASNLKNKKFTYQVEETLYFADGDSWSRGTFHIEVPSGASPLVLGTLSPVPPAVGIALIQGPQGPAGPAGPPGVGAGDPGPQGPAGPQGATGGAGPANVLTVGTVTTGAPGSAAQVTITGTSPAQTVNYTIPRGDVGAQGVQGGAGPQGPAGPASTVPGPAGPAGPQGAQGPPGDPSQLASVAFSGAYTDLTGRPAASIPLTKERTWDIMPPYSVGLIRRNATTGYPARPTDREDVTFLWYGTVDAATAGPGFKVGIDEFVSDSDTAGDPSFDVVIDNTNIQTALDANAAGTRFLIKAGTYRLTAPLIPKSGQVLMGETGTIISGSVVLSSWTNNGDGTWYASGALPGAYTDGGVCENLTNNECQKREQVFVDGLHLDRYISKTALGTIANGFFEDYAANRVYITQDPAGKTIEMSKTAHLVRSVAGGVASNSVRLTGLTFQHAASPSQLGAVYLESAADWEIDHCVFQWNHAIGMHSTNSPRVKFHHNNVHHNGQLGIGSHKSHGSVYEDNEIHSNNTDLYWGGDWESGGIKVTFGDDVIVRRNSVHDNTGIAVWYDIDNRRGIIDNNDINNNYADGVRFEISYGCKITNNRLAGNGFAYGLGPGRGGTDKWSALSVAAININSSPDVEIAFNTVGLNQNGVFAQMRDRGNSASGYGMRDLKNLWVHDNTITMTNGTRFGEGVSGLDTLSMGSLSPTPYYDVAQKNNRFNFNTYLVASLSNLRFGWQESYRTFATFQSYGQEANGTCSLAPQTGLQIVTGGDDGNWHNTGAGYYASNGTRIYLGDVSASDADRHGWMRLVGVDVPQGATISTAKLRLHATGLSTAIPALTINAEASGNAAAPTSRANVNAKPVTTASVAWTPSAWVNGTWYDSPSIVSIIQEIVNRSDWVRGNSILLFVRTTTAGFATVQQISFQAFDGDPLLSPNLQVTWS